MGLPAFINLWIGRTAERFGYHIQRIDRKPHISANAIELALALTRSNSPNPVIVQIGAFDGSFQDPLKDVLDSEDNYGKAVLVEPQPTAVSRLKSTYQKHTKVMIEPSVVGVQEGTSTLYT
ncbi:MAG: hypothetical protein AAF571_01300, partial [Verrucomicrobiota bacterium]